MTAKELRIELQNIISTLTASGFTEVEAETCEKLVTLSAAASALGLKEGKHLIDNLSTVIAAIMEGKSTYESGKVRLTALDFYVKKALSGDKET